MFRQPIGAMLRFREHERFLHVALIEERQQQRRLQMRRHRIDRLRDAHRRRRAPLEIDHHRRAQHLARQLHNRRRHRRAEEQRLALRRHVPEDAADVRQKAHVEHPIGFVEDQVFQAGQLGVRRAEMIEQPARRGDDDVDAAAERVLLRAHAHAAEDRGAGDRRVHGEVVEVFENLRRQLARGREDQRARRARPRARLLHQAVENRQQERGGLAAARHGAGQQVAAFERRRNGVGLNGRRPGEAEVFDAAKQIGVELELTKRHVWDLGE